MCTQKAGGVVTLQLELQVTVSHLIRVLGAKLVFSVRTVTRELRCHLQCSHSKLTRLLPYVNINNFFGDMIIA